MVFLVRDKPDRSRAACLWHLCGLRTNGRHWVSTIMKENWGLDPMGPIAPEPPMGGPTKAPAPGRVKSHSRRGRPLALIIRGGAGHALGGMGGAASVVWARPRPREICGGVMRMPFWRACPVATVRSPAGVCRWPTLPAQGGPSAAPLFSRAPSASSPRVPTRATSSQPGWPGVAKCTGTAVAGPKHDH
jgi:hypothetical protein